jgi:hypothetical protein
MTWVVMFCCASFCRADPTEPRAFDTLAECREAVHRRADASLDWSKSTSRGAHDRNRRRDSRDGEADAGQAGGTNIPWHRTCATVCTNIFSRYLHTAVFWS